MMEAPERENQGCGRIMVSMRWIRLRLSNVSKMEASTKGCPYTLNDTFVYSSRSGMTCLYSSSGILRSSSEKDGWQ